MKISIKSVPYLQNSAPEITSEMFDVIWGEWWKFRIYKEVGSIEQIEILINQAFKGSPIHFYITINGVPGNQIKKIIKKEQ